MEVHRQTDERGGTTEERWREIFDKVFAGLRSDHPADEWTLRIVDHPPGKPTVVAECVDPPSELLEAEVTEEVAITEAAPTQEATAESVQQPDPAQTASEPSEALANGEQAIPSNDVNDVIALSNPENLDEAAQSAQEDAPAKEPLSSQPTEEPVAGDAELLAQPHDGQVESEVAELECQSEHAQHLHDAPGDDVAQALDQGHDSANEVPLTTLDDPTNEEVADASGDQATNEQETVVDGGKETHQESIAQEPVGPEVRSEPIQSETLQAESGQEDVTQQEDFVASANAETEEALEPDVGSIQMAHLQAADLEPVAKQSAEEPAVVNEAPVEPTENGSPDQVTQEQGGETFEEPHESQAIRMYAETHFISTAPDLPRTDMDNVDMDPPMVEVTLDNQEAYRSDGLMNGDAYDDPEKQIDELEVKPVQVEQESVSHQAEATAGKAEQASQTPPRPSSPPAKKGQQEEHSRKPEWLRRPLVRKGSVGRFLGRMKETMQSKRFHADRLPVVPPPLPEPPKRPPRRKTLHNLDLTRESLNTSGEQSHAESVPPVQTTPPPPAAPQSVASTETDNRSATLRSTASERRRKNSVGRFLGKVLAKHANQSESGTAAEEAPLLQQQDVQCDAAQQKPQEQTVDSSVTPATPARSVSPTPAPSEKSKRLPHASLTDVSQYFRRILRPKTPTHDEVKSGKHAPERPPPPHPHADDTTDGACADNPSNEKKPVVKQGRVHFKCQKCEHQWRSAKGLARFEITASQVGEGICHGEVLVRLYGQQCNRCPVGTDEAIFEAADWSAKEMERALTELLADVSRRHYPGYPRRPETDERGRRAHQRRLCQACQEGVCQIKAPC